MCPVNSSTGLIPHPPPPRVIDRFSKWMQLPRKGMCPESSISKIREKTIGLIYIFRKSTSVKMVFTFH